MQIRSNKTRQLYREAAEQTTSLSHLKDVEILISRTNMEVLDVIVQQIITIPAVIRQWLSVVVLLAVCLFFPEACGGGPDH